MLTRIFLQDSPQSAVPKEGDVYKVLHIHDHKFELLYGYYEACERENPAIDPMPIYPDFVKEPWFTKEGLPFVTKMQDICEHYHGKNACFSECADCGYYSHGEDLIGVCVCPQKHQNWGGQADGIK